MNKKITTIIVSLVIIAAAAAAGAYFWMQNKNAKQESDNENQVRDLVIEFGKKLQNVPLSGTTEIAVQAMKDNYSDFVSSELLAQWQEDPTKAPGRLTSSPWPDRIEISSVTKLDENMYFVQGNVIEITSQEVVSGGVAAKYSAAITVKKINAKWQITGFEKGDYISSSEEGNSAENATDTASNSSENKAELKIETLKEGTGEGVKNGDQITVHYVGKLEDGTKFDSSYDRGVAFQFTLGAGQVIAGWDQGILGMKKGEIRRLTIPPSLAYGSQGVVRVIPPNATLIFEVELLQIN